MFTTYKSYVSAIINHKLHSLCNKLAAYKCQLQNVKIKITVRGDCIGLLPIIPLNVSSLDFKDTCPCSCIYTWHLSSIRPELYEDQWFMFRNTNETRPNCCVCISISCKFNHTDMCYTLCKNRRNNIKNYCDHLSLNAVCLVTDVTRNKEIVTAADVWLSKYGSMCYNYFSPFR